MSDKNRNDMKTKREIDPNKPFKKEEREQPQIPNPEQQRTPDQPEITDRGFPGEDERIAEGAVASRDDVDNRPVDVEETSVTLPATDDQDQQQEDS